MKQSIGINPIKTYVSALHWIYAAQRMQIKNDFHVISWCEMKLADGHTEILMNIIRKNWLL